MLQICLEDDVCLYRPVKSLSGQRLSKDHNWNKNKLQHIELSDTTGTINGTGFYGQMKHKK